MGNSENSKSTIYWTVASGIVVALISAWGAYHSGGAAKEREISATQTAEIRIMTLTPEPTSTPYPTNTPNIIESTRVVTLEVTRIVEVFITAESTPYPTYTSTEAEKTAEGTSTIVPSVDSSTKLKPDGILASSINNANVEKFAVDGNLKTAWESGWADAGPGKGWLQFNFRSTKTLTKLRLYSPDPFPQSNSRFKSATLILSDKSSRSIDIPLFDGWVDVPLDPPAVSDSFQLVVDSVYGSGNFLTVYEIELYGK